MENYKNLETERLILKPTTVEDSDFILKLFNTPKWLEFVGNRNLKNLEDASLYIQKKMIPQFEKLGYSNYTVIKKDDSIKIGCCGLYDREGLEGVDIGFAFLPEFENLGYGYESAIKLIEIAKSEFNIQKISAITSKHNFASQKLIDKLGFHFKGIITLPKEEETLFLYEIIFNK